MKSLWTVCCIIFALNCEIKKCDSKEMAKLLNNYPSEKSIVWSLDETIVIVLDSSKKDKSQVYTARYSRQKPVIVDIGTQYFKGHVSDFTVQPQKQMGIFTETGMKHIVVLHDNSTWGTKMFKLDFMPSKISIPQNNNDGKFFIIFDKTERKIHFTQNGGKRFQLLTNNVESFEWQYDNKQNILLVERRTSPEDTLSSLEYIELTPIFNRVLKLTTLADQVQEYSVNEHFIYIYRANNTLLYYKRQRFIRTFYYPVFRIHNIHLVDTDKNSIKVIAENDQESRFYIGHYYMNSNVIEFVLSLPNIEKDYLHKIDSADGVYIATQNNATNSVITYDNGRTWNEMEIKVADNIILSSIFLPGVIAVSLGPSLMISDDGGKSWRRNVDGKFIYMLNHNLGIVIGINIYEPSKILKYTTTYGKDWSTMVIYEKELTTQEVYIKEGSMIIYTVAHDMDHNNYLTRILLDDKFKSSCDDFGYGYYTTNVCNLGQKIIYQRRNGDCYPDQDAMRTKVELCDCNFGDYDCSPNFIRTNFTMMCKPKPGINITATAKCLPGELYKKTRGYRKIDTSVCNEKYKSMYADEMIVCPYTKIDFLVAKTGNVLKMYDENNHKIKNLHGYRERDSYEFDLLNPMMFETNHTVITQHSLNKKTYGRIVIQEPVTIRNLNYDWMSGWLFYIIKPLLMVRAFPVHSTNMTHSKVIRVGNKITTVTSLTVHVIKKIIYWREGSDFKWTILKYNDDNSDIVEILKPETLLEDKIIGSDLVIDYISDQLYYYSTLDGTIIHCDLFGQRCASTFKTNSDHRDIEPTNTFQIAISHMYIYFYDPEEKTVKYWDRSKNYTVEQKLFEHNIHDVTEMKCFSKSVHLYVKCLAEHQNSDMCIDVLNLKKEPPAFQNPIVTEIACPNSKYCDGVFDCFYGEDEEYCIRGPEEVVKMTNHKLHWIAAVVALGLISFIVGSLVLFKRIRRTRFTGVRYNVVENRVLITENVLEDDESDIEMLFS